MKENGLSKMKKHEIFIKNEQKAVSITPATRKLMKAAITEALRYEGFEDAAEVSVTIVDNAAIHRLNLEHRDVDRPTDVLSFPMYDEEDAEMTGFEEYGDTVILGDIVLSAEKALEQANEYGHSAEREIAFLCVHSTLHLLGYDHERSEEEEKDMFRRQEEILKKMDLERG